MYFSILIMVKTLGEIIDEIDEKADFLEDKTLKYFMKELRAFLNGLIEMGYADENDTIEDILSLL